MKKLIPAAAIGLLALTLAGCSAGATPVSEGPSAPGPDALADVEGVTEISLWHGLGGVNGETLEALIGEFNVEHEGEIQVSSSFQGSYADLLAKYTAGLRDDSIPTVMLAGDIASGYLNDVQRSVSPEAMADANPDGLDLAEIRAAAANYYSVDGSLVAVPIATSKPVLWVNRDLLELAGVPDDTDLSTLDAVADAARKVTAATGQPGLVQPFDGWWFEQLTAGSGNVYCAPENGRGADGRATAISLTEPAQVEAFQTVADLYTDGVGLDVGVDGNAALTAFTGGQVAMMFNSTGALGGVSSAATFNYEALAYPISGDASEAGSVIGGSAMWLSDLATDAEKVAGWTLESYLASAEVQEGWSHTTGYVAINSAVDESETQKAFLDENPMQQLFLDQLENTAVVPATAGCLSGAMTSIRGAVVAQMQSAFSGDIALEDALAAAEAEANTAIEQYLEQVG